MTNILNKLEVELRLLVSCRDLVESRALLALRQVENIRRSRADHKSERSFKHSIRRSGIMVCL